MDKSKKILLIITIALVSILLITGISYAALSYTKTGETQELIVGDIWMKYTESTKIINIENMMPSEEYPNSYFEFEVTGKNTYDKKDIYYEILLDNGEYTGSDTNRTIPIDSQMLRFKLVEVVDGSEVEIFDNRAYSDITNKRIWVDTIGVDDSDYSKTYRLYARIYEHTKICSGQEEDCDYYVNPGESYKDYDWDKLYASIKVSVKGDLEEKSIETDASCFTYEFVKGINPIMAEQDVNDESSELYKCVDYLVSEWGDEIIDETILEGETYESFCRGTGTIWGDTFQDFLDVYDNFSEDDLTYLQDNNILVNSSNIKLTSYDETCGSDVVIPREIDGYQINSIDSIYDGAYWVSIFSGKDIKNIVLLDNIIDINNNSLNRSDIESIEIPNSVIKIGYGAFYDNVSLKEVTIPNSVTEIGDQAFDRNDLRRINFEQNSQLKIIGHSAFSYNKLTSIEIPDSVIEIGNSAFWDNQLTNVVIPNSVTAIGDSAFSYNDLKTVTIGSGIKYINQAVFKKTATSNPNLESVTFTSKTCEEIKNIVYSESYPMKYFPWLATYSPYYQEGYKVDIIGTDGVCSY